MPGRPSAESLFDDHVSRVYGFFAYRVSSREDAEDLTQATFERAIRALARYDERKGSVATWLLAIANNLLIDHYRRGRGTRQVPIGEDGIDADRLGTTPGPENDLGLAPELASALAELGERERELIALRIGGELSGPDIAALTGLSLDNVQQILSRTLRRLRARLEDGA